MRGTFIGIKRLIGEKNGHPYDRQLACITAPMTDKEIEVGSQGINVFTPSIPDRYADLLCKENIGKDIEIELFYSGKYCNIGYCALADKK